MVGENEVGTPGREAMQSSDKGSTLIELLALIGVSLAIVTTVSMAYKQTLQVLGQVQMRSKYLYALDNASEQVRSYADSLSRPLPSEFSIQSPDAAENIICKLSAASPVAGYYECRFPAPSFAEDEVKLPLTRLYRVALP